MAQFSRKLSPHMSLSGDVGRHSNCDWRQSRATGRHSCCDWPMKASRPFAPSSRPIADRGYCAPVARCETRRRATRTDGRYRTSAVIAVQRRHAACDPLGAAILIGLGITRTSALGTQLSEARFDGLRAVATSGAEATWPLPVWSAPRTTAVRRCFRRLSTQSRIRQMRNRRRIADAQGANLTAQATIVARRGRDEQSLRTRWARRPRCSSP